MAKTEIKIKEYNNGYLMVYQEKGFWGCKENWFVLYEKGFYGTQIPKDKLVVFETPKYVHIKSDEKYPKREIGDLIYERGMGVYQSPEMKLLDEK